MKWSTNLSVALLPFLATTFVALSMSACDGGSEGDRCNPDRSSDECNSGLTCMTPATCVISVCCPDKGPYTDPQCACNANPAGCPCTVASAEPSPSDASAE
jgi:hypothetical protein